MGVRDEALRALENHDWSGAVVDDSPPPSTVVQSTRLPVDLFERLMATAEERGVKPGVLVRQFVEQGLSPAGVSGIATVQLDRLRAELDQAVQRARVIPPAVGTGGTRRASPLDQEA